MSNDEEQMIAMIPPISPWGMSYSEVVVAGNGISSSTKRVSLVLATFDYTEDLLQVKVENKGLG